MPSIYDTAQGFRTALLKRDRAALAQMFQAYGLSAARLADLLAALTLKIDLARAAGETITLDWLYRQERFRDLIAQANAEMLRLASFADGLISDGQRGEIERGLRDAQSLLSESAKIAKIGIAFNRVPVQSLEYIVGALGDGSPLRDVLNRYGAATAQAIERSLIEGMVAGENPRKIARRISPALGRFRYEASRIARTETLRAYRESARATYQANSDIISGWQWLSARSLRTCPTCWGMDGQIFPLEKPQGNHPQCRCTLLPVLIGAKPPLRHTGEEVFAHLPDESKRTVLGDAKFEAYRDGKITLRSLVGYRNDPRWGETRWERGLKDALAGEIDAAWGKLPSEAPRLPAPTKQTEPTSPITAVSVIPAGIPVANGLRAPKRGALTQATERTLSAIGKVHGDGELPVIPIERERAKSRFGGYWHKTHTGEATKISLRTGGFDDHPELTLAHEIGHFLDHQGAGERGVFSSVEDGAFAEFRRVVSQTRAIREIERLVKESAIPVMHGGARIEYPVDRKYLTYLLDPKEVWARAYAQYITLRSGDQTLREQLDQLRLRLRWAQVHYPSQWDDDDFAPVAEAVDRLMLKLGWRK